MLEPPSDPLLKLLLELKLCSTGDLRRCRARVRKMAYDLPAFDSVWLDALVQARTLTPFQARTLESPDPNRIRVGPCVVVDRLGGGPLGETFLARPRGGHDLCVTKILRASDQLSSEALDRLKQLVATAHGFAHPSIVVPHTCDCIANQWVLVSRYIPGPHLGELLIRRGRYPTSVVWEIGRQLVEGLAALDAKGIAHGDIRLANVRLTSGGVVVLVDTGVRTALDPDLTVHAGLPPERYDGVAAELIGTGQLPNAASDLYALGCLLWQLLAGRPPFPGGDPLGKLAAHQTRKIDDVRKWAPDTPALLAEGIRRLTLRNIADRPSGFAEVLRIWGSPRRAGRRHLQAFRQRFETAAESAAIPHSTSSVATRLTLVAAFLFAASGVAFRFSDEGTRTRVMSLASQLAARWSPGGATPSPTANPEVPVASRAIPPGRVLASPSRSMPPAASENTPHVAPQVPPAAAHRHDRGGIPLPPPDQQGLIVLTTAGPFEAQEITAVGQLAIRGEPGIEPVIIVSGPAWKIDAGKLRLENIHVRASASRALEAEPDALLQVTSQSLSINGCSFQAPSAVLNKIADAAAREPAPVEVPTSIAWRMADPTDALGGRCAIKDTILVGDRSALSVASAARSIEFTNCLKIGAGPLVSLAAGPSSGRKIAVQIADTTCRGSGPLLCWEIPATWRGKGKVAVETQNCVFDLANRTESLIQFVRAGELPEAVHALELTGEGSIASEDASLAGWVDLRTGAVRPLDPLKLELEGIPTGPFQYAGSASLAPVDSTIENCQVPRLSSSRMPGISPQGLHAPAPQGSRSSAPVARTNRE